MSGELLNQARTLVFQQEAAAREQKVITTLNSESHMIAAGLLNENGILHRSIAQRIAIGIIAAVPVVGLVSVGLFEFLERKMDGIHIWEIYDKATWKTKFNDEEPRIGVELVAKGWRPNLTRVGSITIIVEGVGESVSISGNGYSEVHSYAPNRSTTLAESIRWHELIGGLKERQEMVKSPFS